MVAGLDARPMLAAGEQPVNQVIADLHALGPGDIYKLVAPFLPAPLVDKASSLGISHWVTRRTTDRLSSTSAGRRQALPLGSPAASLSRRPLRSDEPGLG